jgi:hypothetical protein
MREIIYPWSKFPKELSDDGNSPTHIDPRYSTCLPLARAGYTISRMMDNGPEGISDYDFQNISGIIESFLKYKGVIIYSTEKSEISRLRSMTNIFLPTLALTLAWEELKTVVVQDIEANKILMNEWYYETHPYDKKAYNFFDRFEPTILGINGVFNVSEIIFKKHYAPYLMNIFNYIKHVKTRRLLLWVVIPEKTTIQDYMFNIIFKKYLSEEWYTISFFTDEMDVFEIITPKKEVISTWGIKRGNR